MPPRFKRLHSIRRRKLGGRKTRGPLFVFVTSATVAGLLGHAALLASLQRPHGTEWKASTSPELVREAGDDPERLAMGGER